MGALNQFVSTHLQLSVVLVTIVDVELVTAFPELLFQELVNSSVNECFVFISFAWCYDIYIKHRQPKL